MDTHSCVLGWDVVHVLFACHEPLQTIAQRPDAPAVLDAMRFTCADGCDETFS